MRFAAATNDDVAPYRHRRSHKPQKADQQANGDEIGIDSPFMRFLESSKATTGRSRCRRASDRDCRSDAFCRTADERRRTSDRDRCLCSDGDFSRSSNSRCRSSADTDRGTEDDRRRQRDLLQMEGNRRLHARKPMSLRAPIGALEGGKRSHTGSFFVTERRVYCLRIVPSNKPRQRLLPPLQCLLQDQ